MSDQLHWFRLRAMAMSLQSHVSIEAAFEDFGFVQYDPIRSPARAQDLILAQRVEGYRVGDLDRAFESLGLEEGHLHVYGALTPRVRHLLHPRLAKDGTPYVARGFEAEVLAAVKAQGRLDPHEARALLGHTPVVNDWGGTSAASTRAMELLHRHGLLRVVCRRNGLKVYEASDYEEEPLEPGERSRRMVVLLARLLAPVPERGLRQAFTIARWRSGSADRRQDAIRQLRASGELDGEVVDGVTYLWPSALTSLEPLSDERVRFLAPFDPLVWDRGRFAHLWGWEYRFEAYTPAPKRKLGYYALPMFWRGEAVGWVNCATKGGALDVQAGFTENEPQDRQFRIAFEEEVERLRLMLQGAGAS